MNKTITPEEILERIKKLDKDIVEVNMVLLTKEEWCLNEGVDYDRYILKNEYNKYTPYLKRNEKLILTIFIDSKPEYILDFIDSIEEYIKRLKEENPTFYFLKKNYLNFKQNEERMIKIIRAMME
jgi:hypothetical protein